MLKPKKVGAGYCVPTYYQARKSGQGIVSPIFSLSPIFSYLQMRTPAERMGFAPTTIRAPAGTGTSYGRDE